MTAHPIWQPLLHYLWYDIPLGECFRDEDDVYLEDAIDLDDDTCMPSRSDSFCIVHRRNATPADHTPSRPPGEYYSAVQTCVREVVRVSNDIHDTWGKWVYANGCDCVEVIQFLGQSLVAPHTNGFTPSWEV